MPFCFDVPYQGYSSREAVVIGKDLKFYVKLKNYDSVKLNGLPRNKKKKEGPLPAKEIILGICKQEIF